MITEKEVGEVSGAKEDMLINVDVDEDASEANQLMSATGKNDDDEHSETLCGTCGGSYSANEFWIACDVCERWFRRKCVKTTPAKAESIKQYKCPSCSSEKGRQ